MGFLAQTLTLARDLRMLQEGPLPLTSTKILDWLGGEPTASGVRMNADTALRVSAVYDCVRNISEDVAKLPLITYRRLQPRGKDRATDLRLYGILHDVPNPHMTAMQLRETAMVHLLTRGNAYIGVERDGNGLIIGLWPLRPDRMEPPILAADGRLLYAYRLPDGERRALTQDDVMHVRGLSSDGVMGYSPVTLHREAFANAQAALEYGSRVFSNDARPGGVLETKGRLSPEAADRMQRSWEQLHRGLERAHRIAILEEGVEFKAVQITPEDAQYLESRRFSRTEIAGIFRIPPHKIGDLERATFSNIEEQAIEYVTDTLTSWTIRWEQQINKDLLTEAERRVYFVEHLLDALLRARTLERAQALQILRQNGIISADDWLEIENRNPLPNGVGESYLIPANMQIIHADGTVMAQQQPAQPAASPAPASRSTVRLLERIADGYRYTEREEGADGQ